MSDTFALIVLAALTLVCCWVVLRRYRKWRGDNKLFGRFADICLKFTLLVVLIVGAMSLI